MKRFLLIVLILAIGASVFAEENAEEMPEAKVEEKPKETFEEFVDRMLKEKYSPSGCLVALYLSKKIDKDNPPIEVALDNSDSFSEDNLLKFDELKSHYGYHRDINYYGKMLISKDGTYCFSGKIVKKSSDTKPYRIDVGIKDHAKKWHEYYYGTNLSEKLQREGGTDVGKMYVDLKRGFWDFYISFRQWDSWGQHDFTLQYWDVNNPMERKIICPATLYYLKRWKGE